MMQQIALIELAVCGAIWLLAVIWPSKRVWESEEGVGVPASRFGILLTFAGFAFILTYVRPWGFEKGQAAIIAGMVFAPIAVILALTARYYLSKRWRVDNKYDDYFILVKSGPYSIVRHPMYTASLCMLLAIGIPWTPLPMLVLSIFFFVVGLELRLEKEELELANRFQDEFAEYQSQVKAYIPFIR